MDRSKLIEIKRAIRKYTHRSSNGRRIVRDRGIDGYVVLESLPESINDLDDALTYFENYMVIECMPSAYDCTGQAFTSWYKVFQRNGGFFAYHSVCFDV